MKTSKGTGDLLVTIDVAVPQNLNKEAEEAVKAFAAATAGGDPPRRTWPPRPGCSEQSTAARRHGIDFDQPIFVISVAAELADMHPQTLRQYDRLGIVSPSRAPGKSRRYSQRDVDMLREVQRLSQEGVSLEGIKRILELENQVAALQLRVAELTEELPRRRPTASAECPDLRRRTRRRRRQPGPRAAAAGTVPGCRGVAAAVLTAGPIR